MGKQYKTKKQSMNELKFAQLRIAEPEKVEIKGEWAKNELRASEEKFFKAFQSCPSSMAIRSLKDGRFFDVNDAYIQATGYSREELVGRISSELGIVDPETIRTAKQIIETQGFIRNWERTFKTKSGEIRTGLFSATVIQIEDESCLLSAFQDITESKMAEEALRKAEEKYRSIFENAVEGIYRSSPNGRYIEVNPSFARMLGYNTPDELKNEIHDIGRQLYIDPVKREECLRILEKQDIAVFEIQLRRRDGGTIWVSNTVRTFRDGRGKITHFEGVVKDITARKLVEEALKESQQRLADIINFLPDATFVIDRDGRVIAWNKAIEEMTGIRAQDILGRGNYEYALPFYGERRPILIDLVLKPREEIEAKYVSTERGNMILIGEAYMPALRGGEVYLSGKASILRDSRGNIIGAIESIRDITVRRRVEEALIQAEGKYRGIFENAVMGIFQTTPSGRIISANQAFARILGYASPEEVLNTVTDIAQQVYVYPERHPEFLKLMNEHGTLQGHEVQFFRKNRTIAWVTVNGCTVRDGNDNLLYYEGFIQDITDRKILESQLFQTQKMEAIGTLAGGIAHDFNNILSAIMGYTDMALTNPTVDDNLRHYLKQVFKAGERARDLVKQILTFSRQTDNEPRPLKVSPIIKEVLKLLRASLPSTIKIRQDIQPEADIVLADPTHIHQLMMNLCTNAAHAMHNKKGELKVSLGPVEINSHDTLIIHHGLTAGTYLQLTVNDTGTGIALDIINRIFDPFFTTKRPGEGTGMGLSVAHGIVKSYKGAITVESEMGKGSTFRVYLPLLTKIQEKQEIRNEAYIPRGKECILFVDDEEGLVQLGRDMLISLGYEVVGSTSSLEALELLRAKPDRFDLVITDMTMPNMTGSALAQEIMRIRPDTPVIICTGFSEVITPETAKAIGIKEFIMKPFIANKLAVTVRHALDHKK